MNTTQARPFPSANRLAGQGPMRILQAIGARIAVDETNPVYSQSCKHTHQYHAFVNLSLI